MTGAGEDKIGEAIGERITTGSHNTFAGLLTSTARITDTCARCGTEYHRVVAITVENGEIVAPDPAPQPGTLPDCPACRGG